MVREQVIVGSGLIARALGEVRGLRGSVLYAAGPSNSACERQSEFDRERERLAAALRQPGRFVYVSTCSSVDSPYVRHKRAMEELVRERGDYLVCRLPIVAGRTPNPHTLLNWLYGRIVRSEEFDLQVRARRYVIDVADAAEAIGWLLRGGARDEVVNVAAPVDYPVREIVRVFERITGKHARMNRLEEGRAEELDTRRMREAPCDFSEPYLDRVLHRYYHR